jgi:hypothetical protein
MNKVEQYVYDYSMKVLIEMATVIAFVTVLFLGPMEHIVELCCLLAIKVIAASDRSDISDHAKLEGIDILKRNRE